MKAWEEFDVIIQDFEYYTDSSFKEMSVTNRKNELVLNISFLIEEELQYKYKLWFVKRIKSLDYILFKNEVIELNESSEYELLTPLTGPNYVSNIRIFSLKIKNRINIIKYVISNPSENELLATLDKKVLILDLFNLYCNDIIRDYNIGEVFSSIVEKNPTLLPPIKKREVKLPHNLSDQFIIDITPIFLKKLYKATNLIFRVELFSSEKRRVTSSDRLTPKSISSETDEVLKNLGLNLTWEDIFIFNDL